MTYSDSQSIYNRVRVLHGLFNLLTGSTQEFKMWHHFVWERWMLKWNEEHLKTVVAHTNKFNARVEPRYKRWMTIKNMIENCEKFSNWLEEAEQEKRTEAARARAPKHGPREKILEAVGRVPYPENEVRTPEQILKDMDFMQKCKRENGLI